MVDRVMYNLHDAIYDVLLEKSGNSSWVDIIDVDVIHVLRVSW